MSDMCLGCGKKLKKSDTSVQCTQRSLWCYKECSGISNDFLRCLEEAKKNHGVCYWACRPCTVYAMGMTQRFRDKKKRLDEVEEKSEKNAEDIAKGEKRMDKIEGKMKNQSSQNVDEVYEEFREREAKKLNVIMHGVLECDEKEKNGEKRMEWDMNGIEEIFKVLELNLTKDDVKFCRRVGEKSQAQGPWSSGSTPSAPGAPC